MDLPGAITNVLDSADSIEESKVHVTRCCHVQAVDKLRFAGSIRCDPTCLLPLSVC